MSQADRFRLTPGLAKKEETRVLKEKQVGSIGIASSGIGKTTPQLAKKTQPLKTGPMKRVTINESRGVPVRTTNKPTFKSTPIAKGLLSKPSKTSGPPMHGSHAASHQNDKLSTPLNRKTYTAFGSSAKQDSTSKENSARKLMASRAINSNRHPINTTPVNRNYTPSVTNSISKDSNHQNSIVNGVDYSAMMARKAELGYTGPGYIVEFTCDEKELKNYHVQKGLWKITTISTTPNKNTKIHIMGAPLFATRLDVEQAAPAKTTPGKSIFHNIDFDWNPLKSTTGILKDDSKMARNLNYDEYVNNSTAQGLDLETSLDHKYRTKKSLRWADILEEKYSPALGINSPYNVTPKNTKIIDMGALTGSLITSNSSDSKKPGTEPKIRRSLSMNDINDIIIAQDEIDERAENNSVTCDMMVQQTNNVQLTFSPATAAPAVLASNKPISLNETFELETPSKALLDNKLDVEAEEKPIFEETCSPEKPQISRLSLNESPTIPFCFDSEMETIDEKTSIPMSFDHRPDDLKAEENTIEDNTTFRLNITYDKSNLIDNLQHCTINLRTGLTFMNLNEPDSKLQVDTSEYIKISNLINELDKSLKTIKEKLSF